MVFSEKQMPLMVKGVKIESWIPFFRSVQSSKYFLELQVKLCFINAIFDVLQSVLISLKQVEWKMKIFFMMVQDQEKKIFMLDFGLEPPY